jgi:hypothetical protein
VIATVLALAAPASARSRLVGAWPFNEGSGTTVADISHYGDTGTIFGGVQWVAGHRGGALSFDGSTGRVSVPDNSALEPTAGLTVAAWVKSAGIPGNFKYIAAKGASGCIAASYALYTGPSGGLIFYVSNGVSYSLSPDAGTTVWDGNWHYVAGTYDGSTVRLFVDGDQVGSGAGVASPIGYGLSTGNDLFFGHYDGCAGLDFQGAIESPRIWAQALSQAQIVASSRRAYCREDSSHDPDSDDWTTSSNWSSTCRKLDRR